MSGMGVILKPCFMISDSVEMYLRVNSLSAGMSRTPQPSRVETPFWGEIQ